MNWDADEWQIGVPQGKFGTFTLLQTHQENSHAEFHLVGARVFAGLDVYNAADGAATVTLCANGSPATSVTIEPKELRRIRTDWRESTPDVFLDLADGQGLVFDNLAYLEPARDVATTAETVAAGRRSCRAP
jgi:hypothetical protein